MRRIGTLTDPDQARRFADYLFTLSIECSVDIDESPPASETIGGEDESKPAVTPDRVCNLWIRDEADVSKAKEELESFRQSPDDSKYQVGGTADRIRKQNAAEEKRKKRLVQKVAAKSPGGGSLMGLPVRQQSIPVVISVIILSVIASFSTGVGKPKESQVPGELTSEETIYLALSFADWRDYAVTKDPYVSIKKGEVWRLITPMFLHGNTFHLAFNMMGMFFLGSAIERLQGSLFVALLFVTTGVFGTLFNVSLPPPDALPSILQGLGGSPRLIGASGAVYGLFGYLWIRPLMSPKYPIRMMPSNVATMLVATVFMIFFVPGIANGAHIGGLIAGVIIAAVVSRVPVDQYS
ncbi:MAG: rhomboid family intramembrane serine protease [Planctomycetales bacterium]|nr:rhomboid family intramembrane serine protease [Planctomycetales bacterium]